MKVLSLAALLQILSLSIAAQNILSNGSLPKDLRITIDNTGSVQFANYYRNTILPDGSVTFEYTWRGLPVQRSFSSILILKGQKAPKAPTKKNKLSTKQLAELARLIESSGFLEMQDSYYGHASAPTESVNCSTHADGKAITVTANGKTKQVYFFLGCSYGDFEPLKKFLNLYGEIEKAISGVKMKELQPAATP